jgi:hypothetical protein
MNLNETYTHILKEIELGHRALIRLSAQDLEDLDLLLRDSLNNPPELEKVLCVVEHSSTLYGKFEKNLLLVLNSPIPDSLIVFGLNCARKHIVEARFQRGQRLEFDFLELLKKLLYHPNPEVVEWALRLIESCGNQGVYFLKEFDKIRPPPWKWFNAHQRAVREIITLLERRWSPFEKPKLGTE